MSKDREIGTSGKLESFFGLKKDKKETRKLREKNEEDNGIKSETTIKYETLMEEPESWAPSNDLEKDNSELENPDSEEKELMNYENLVGDSTVISEDTETDCMFLVGTEYNAQSNKARLKFYNLQSQKLVLVDDPTGHEPYLITAGITPKTITKMFKKHVTHAETIQLIDLLDDWKTKEFTRAYTVTPSDVPPVRERLPQAWEAKIRYHLNWICDRQVTPGLTYKIDHEEVLSCPALQPIEPSKAESAAIGSIKDTMGESDLLEEYLPFFLTPIPEIKAAAIDIETDSKEGRIPKPEDPRDTITCICLVDTDGMSWAFCLTDEEKSGAEIEAELKIESLKVVPFFWKTKSDREKQERKLLEGFFEKFKDYPFIISFNGDLFDFPYLDARARRLGVNDIPITYNRRRQMSFFSHAIHIDTYKWYQNPAIRIYAHSAAYSSFGLDTVARALLGKGKIDLQEEEIRDLPLNDLIRYCQNDTKITLELLTFDDFTPFTLMILLARICHMPLEELISTRVSTWLQNLFYYEHRRRGYLIPNQKDISREKGRAASSTPITKGKQFEGAIVIDPTPGLHFDVKVMDFACLDEETEILTRDGWKNKDEIRENELVLALDTSTNELEYNQVQKKFEYDYNGEMYHLDTQSIEQLITPNHRVLYFDRDRRKPGKDKMKWRNSVSISEAKDMDKYWYAIPYTGKWKKERRENFELDGISLDMDSFLAFYGIFLSDGGISTNRRAIFIYQSKEPELTQMRQIVENFCTKNKYKFTENKYKSGQGRKYTRLTISNKLLAQAFSNLLNKQPQEQQAQFIPRELLMLNSEQLQILWNGLMLGDGSKAKYREKDCYRYFGSTSKQLADDVQELSIKLGIGARLSERIADTVAYGKVYKNHTHYRVTFSYERRNVVSKQGNPIHTHPYSGKVWCVSTKNGSIMIRRNGKISISGNSLYPSIISTRNLSYETMMCGHPDCEKNRDNHIPDTDYYVCAQHRGILAEIIGFLKDIRVFWFKPFSKKKESPEEKKLYSIIEKSLKVLINASYGTLGATFFNFFCMSSAESTTAVGRYAIMQAIEKCKELGINVLYGDTDSVFLLNPSSDQVNALIDWSENELRIGLDVDKAYRYVAFSKRKKNYVGVLTDGSVDIKGLMVKKSNTPVFIQKAFKQVMEILQDVETREDFRAARKDIHGVVKDSKTRLKENNYSAEELAISVQMTKTTAAYKGNPQHIKAARLLEKHLQETREDDSFYLKPGTILRFVKTQTSGGVTPVELLKDPRLVDIKSYETQLESTFTQVLDTLGITLFDSQKRARRQFKSLAGSLTDEDLKKRVNIGEVMGRKDQP
ncbi:MAG: DNA polymerase domain-containing protein [Candidatus Heimdallarchaeota archaeon]